MKIFSKSSQYAIRALMCSLETDSYPRFSTKEICSQAGIPEAFARKALQKMTKAGLLQGFQGARGGYLAVRNPSEISLLDIVLAVDGEDAFAECPMGLKCQAQTEGEGLRSCKDCPIPNPKCGLSHICALHNLWKETRKLVISQLEQMTLQDMMNNLIEFSDTSTI